MTQAFYDALAPYYHLLYADWKASITRQARGLAAVLTEFGVDAHARILDAACGIGTQSLGLAALGYRVTASDLSPGAIARARCEADARGLTIDFAVADLRHLSATFTEPFDAVLTCDNAIPHLLSDDEIRQAFVECRKLLRPDGVLCASVRDYAAIERRTPDIHPYGTRIDGDRRYSAEQIWEWDGDQYDVMLRLTEERADGDTTVREFRSRYYAVEIPTLERLLRDAGFSRVERPEGFFFQPLLLAVNAD
jgi:glycine/sarcosine N-methyltransferase